MRGLRIGYPRPSQRFPLSIHSSGRYLVQADGTPFLIHGDTPWSIAAQLTDEQVDTYLEAMSAAGVNAILFNAPEKYFTSQTPTYRNVDNVAPFTTMTDFASALTAYWNRVDYIVNQALARNILCIINPAYLGYAGGQEGWAAELRAEADSDLTTYGTRLGDRYRQPNIIWCAGGDYSGSDGSRAKQAKIFEGIIAQQPNALITAHNDPDVSGYTYGNGFPGWNLNSAYATPDNGAYPYAQIATEYARTPAIPIFFLEGRYEQESGYTDAIGRIQMYTPVLSGACGFLIGNNPRWHFESPRTLYSYSGTYEDSYTSTLTLAVAHAKSLFEAFDWWKLQPKTDTSLVTSSLGSGLARICPALANDGTFAMIWVPSSQTITVNTSALTGVAGNVRIRRFSPTTGQYTTIVASVAKTSSQSVSTGGEGVIVIEEAA